jgi:pyruvate/2-oxoglutarate dehydrogenase complex dihydrolipoamide dehydrogenase (E3) component
LVLTPERLITVITADDRPIPKSDQDCVTAFRTLLAYSGPYRIKGDRLVTRVEVSANEAWTGTEQARDFRLEGDRLVIETAPAPDPNAPGSTDLVKAILEWSRSG